MSSQTTPSGTARVPFSFELYPPRSVSNEEALHETVRRLAAAGPDFLSVTYGAGGSTGGRSLDVLRFIRQHTDVEPLAHLTCVGNTYAGAAALIREFLDAGILSFLALRGDPPLGETEAYLGDLESAAQLVQLIDRVQAERAPYEETPVPGIPGAAQVAPRRRVNIAVAAFPKGHPRSAHRTQDVEALLAKQAAGATFAITQLFFHPDDYLAFLDRARAAGVTIPILPGIMPITSPNRLARVLELTGEAVRRARHRPRRRADARGAPGDRHRVGGAPGPRGRRGRSSRCPPVRLQPARHRAHRPRRSRHPPGTAPLGPTSRKERP